MAPWRHAAALLRRSGTLSSVASLPLQIIVMAAGEGKRMHSARPKMLHALAGRPLVAHVIDAVRVLSPRALVVVVGHGGDAVREALVAPDLSFVTQDPPRGTGDAVRIALAALPDDGVTLVVNGDCPLIPAATFGALVDVASAGKLAILTALVSDPTGLGRVVRDTSGAVRAIVEERDASADERLIAEIYTGALAAPTALLRRFAALLSENNAQREYYLTEAVAIARREGVAVEAHVAPDERDVLGVNDRAQLAAIERIVQARAADALMRAGTSLADPSRIDVRGVLNCGRDVRIDVGCVFEGTVVLADNVVIGAYCVMKNVTVGAGTEIAPFSHLDNAIIGARCRVGPYSRLRPGATLGEDVHIGNFVEVKASTLGRGSKANHLAYVGDSTVGAGVNIGAGSITANYDGVNKHRTVIEDDASIGSNCVLVAPVKVGKGATIGAGSTITKDAPAGELTVARAGPVVVAGWKRPVKKPSDTK
jgi:bifunctional UDP-N-acetylglucosamine pyrophosphorylase / glucosamine-1-phosphate N-acetyltransferase